MSSSPQTAHLALRVGLAFAFLYPPYAALSDPVSWAAYFPAFVHALPISPLILLHAFGVLEVVIALWILSGWRIRFPAALAALMLLGIVAFNFSQLDVLFRDLSLAALALALVLWPSPNVHKEESV
ncbi:MAG: DoxX family membrane protein [bacterium]|nr:DoxX family membrane protein [bacterium]